VNLEAAEDGATATGGAVREGVEPGVGIDLRAGPEVRLLSVEAGGVRVGTSDAKSAATGRLATPGADGLAQGAETVLEKADSDLLEDAILETEHLLTDDGVLVVP